MRMARARPSSPLLLGHRGASKYAPENTFAAFDLALAHGCDGFEFDVRYTSDRRAILCHDPAIDGLLIEDSTYPTLVQNRQNSAESSSRELRQEDPSFLPCLEDVLRKYHSVRYLDIELKVRGMEEDVVRLLTTAPPAGEYLVSSFLPAALLRLHEICPELPLGVIGDTSEAFVAVQRLPVSVAFAHYPLITKEFVEECRSRSLQVVAWTANDRAEMMRLAALGVEGIISDDTELLCNTLRK